MTDGLSMREMFPFPNLRGTFVWEAESFQSVPFSVFIPNVKNIYIYNEKIPINMW